MQGTVSQGVHVDDARAVAIGTDGRTFWAYLDAQRDFTLTVPVGQSYRIVVANALEQGGEAVVGHLVVTDASGDTEWLGANEPGTVDLGTLYTASEIVPDSAHSGSGSCNHSDDCACHEGGHHGGGGGNGDGLCDDGQDQPLSPSQNPGSKCADHDHHHGGHGNQCDAGKGEHSDGGDDDGGEPMCPSGDGGHGDAGHPADAGPPKDAGSGGGGGVGAECLTSADCAPPLACIAGFCTATSVE